MINLQPADSAGGENFGWRLMEGTRCFNPSTDCNDGRLTLPVLEYSHSIGCSVSGGYRYRGMLYPGLEGVYFYGDYCSGRIWGARRTAEGVWTRRELADTDLSISSFGEDSAGQLYLSDLAGGTIYRIVSEP